jgi:hypothetical protein
MFSYSSFHSLNIDPLPCTIACLPLLIEQFMLAYMVEVEMMMGFSSLTWLGHACPLSNKYWSYDLKLDQDGDENELRVGGVLGHGKTGEVLNGVAR